jgi:hypothetical protein
MLAQGRYTGAIRMSLPRGNNKKSFAALGKPKLGQVLDFPPNAIAGLVHVIDEHPEVLLVFFICEETKRLLERGDSRLELLQNWSDGIDCFIISLIILTWIGAANCQRSFELKWLE